MQERYDIYLKKGCNAFPDVGNLIQQYPFMAKTTFQEHVVTIRPGGPGLLRVALPKEIASAFLAACKQQKAVGYMINVAYRRPKVTKEEALPIAERAAKELQEKDFATYTFEPVVFQGEEPAYWCFVASSEQLLAEGKFPGAIFIDVDKLDGHIWQEEDYRRLQKSQGV